MRSADFTNSPAGRLVPTEHNAQAFLPNPLPPEINLADFALDLAIAGIAIGELRGASRIPGLNPFILIGPLQRLEAQTSSAMEGTHTTADELVLEAAEVGKGLGSEAHEVVNYIRALNWALTELSNIPLSGRLLRGAHARLLEGVRGHDKTPGEFARNQNMVGGTRLETARFIPPPPSEKLPCIADLEKYLNRADKSGTSPLIDLALAHYQFETIHPFGDGNGRVGRMLISLMSISEGMLDIPVLYMSPDLDRHKDQYIDLMYNVSAKGEWTNWIRFFLQSLTRSCQHMAGLIGKMVDLQNDFRNRATQISRSANTLMLVDMLFEVPAVTPKAVVKRLGITDAAARNLLRQLKSVGVLEEHGSYRTVWLARELIELSRP